MKRLERISTVLAVALALVATSAFAATKKTLTPTPAANDGTDTKTSKDTKAKKPVIVNINTADEKTLVTLPGVGKSTAQAIVKARPFKAVEDLEKVKGIGAKKYAKLKDLVTIADDAAASKSSGAAAAISPTKPPATPKIPKSSSKSSAGDSSSSSSSSSSSASSSSTKLAPGQTVDINTASKELLDALPGIGPVKAQAIIDGRPYSTIEDIMKVKGIKEGEFAKIKDLITVR